MKGEDETVELQRRSSSYAERILFSLVVLETRKKIQYRKKSFINIKLVSHSINALKLFLP